MEKRNLIIETALHHYKRSGIKEVSMDDLAQDLRVSKKTIYQHFKDKQDLVKNVFTFDLDRKKQMCIDSCSDTDNAIQQLLNISSCVNNNLKDISQIVIKDLNRYYPGCFELMEEFSHGFLYNFLKENLNTGISQGYFREDLDINMTCSFYVSLLNSIFPQSYESFRDNDLASIHKQLYVYHLHAICSDKGIEYLKTHL